MSYNLPCNKKFRDKVCDGELVVCKGGQVGTLVKCNKCGHEILKPMTLLQYNQYLAAHKAAKERAEAAAAKRKQAQGKKGWKKP